MTKKVYHYNVLVSFKMQLSFSESEVEQSEEGDRGDMSPKQAALEAYGREVEECLTQQFGGIGELEVWADFDDLLGVVEE
ncbi:MAG: hypothetical protein NXI32_15290 [bacterium]|nr:hypothetical protein [bacterium]